MNNLDVKEIRKNLGLTQQEFADKLGVSRNTILNYERGETIPSSKSIILHTMLTESKIGDVNNVKTKQIIIEKELAILNTNKPVVGIPLLPFDAFAGIGDGSIQGVNFDTIEERYVVPLFDGIKIDFMIPVRGSSMYPKYSSGDVVACRLIKELLFVQWNKVYIIDSISQGVIMKRLLKAEDIDHIICRSDNKEYSDFLVPRKDIRSIALVVGVIRLE
jgi:phage repressor protein C with HTH and peptisase S24 domain